MCFLFNIIKSDMDFLFLKNNNTWHEIIGPRMLCYKITITSVSPDPPSLDKTSAIFF